MSAIDYDLLKIKAFAFDVDGVLSPSTIPLSVSGEPMRMVNIKDGYALQLAVRSGYMISIITGGTAEAVRIRFNGLGIKDVYMGASQKLPVLQRWMTEKELNPEEVLYMGDDIPDLPAMRYVGLPCTPYDGCHESRITARYISPYGGGYGCARDVLEQVMKAQGRWLADERAFGW